MTQPSKRIFPHAIDSSMLASFRSCPRKFAWQYIDHWKPQAESVHLVAGGAFARGVEVARKAFYEGLYPVYIETLQEDGTTAQKASDWLQLTPGDASASEAAGVTALMHAYGDFECPPDSAKSLERTMGALEFYFASYPLGEDGMTPVSLPNGKFAIEFSFANPLPVLHPVSGNPILYTGRADAIMNFAGSVYVVDEKTTSSLGQSWARQWEMRAQFTAYSWACQEFGLHPAGTIIRGVSILKTKYDTQQAITYRAQWEIERWLEQTCRDIERMKQMWESGWFDYALDHACGEYGGCSMLQVCKSPEPEVWLPMYFTQRVWDPLARSEVTVEEWEKSWEGK